MRNHKADVRRGGSTNHHVTKGVGECRAVLVLITNSAAAGREVSASAAERLWREQQQQQGEAEAGPDQVRTRPVVTPASVPSSVAFIRRRAASSALPHPVWPCQNLPAARGYGFSCQVHRQSSVLCNDGMMPGHEASGNRLLSHQLWLPSSSPAQRHFHMCQRL